MVKTLQKLQNFVGENTYNKCPNCCHTMEEINQSWVRRTRALILPRTHCYTSL